MKKLLRNFVLALPVILLLALSAHAADWRLAWDPYSDPNATELRVYSNTVNQFPGATSTMLGTALPTSATISPPLTGPSVAGRVYYNLAAYGNVNGNGVEVFADQSVSILWDGSGGGTLEPVSKPGGIRLIDCETASGADAALCTSGN